MGAVNTMEAERWRGGEQVGQADAEPDGRKYGVARRHPGYLHQPCRWHCRDTPPLAQVKVMPVSSSRRQPKSPDAGKLDAGREAGMNRKAIERARADLRRAWQTGDDNLMAAAQLVLLKELRRAGFRGEEEIKKISGAKGALTRGRKLRTQS